MIIIDVALRLHTYEIHCNCYGCKNDNFQIIICDVLAQNIDCGYFLEQPHEEVLKNTHNL